MGTETSNLPLPSAEALATSERLSARIREVIADADGWIRFDRYMQCALYEPGLGYYSGGSAKFGALGDFTTAAELGPALPRALAVLFGEFAGERALPRILELGAGSGALAHGLLDALALLGYRDVRYEILEPSAELRARQRELLERHASSVTWLDGLPADQSERFVVANEVVDALPVVRFEKTRGTALPVGVSAGDDGLQWCIGPEDPELAAAVETLEAALGTALPDGYRSEICLVLRGFVAALAESLGRGAAVLIDYGLVRRDYYHPQRSDGTLICHYRHRAHGDPFLFPGLQDISSWVDFSACADAARAAGLDVAGFTTQGLFLAETMATAPFARFPALGLAELGATKMLLLPGEMGERFKLLLLARDSGAVHLPGRDFRSRL